ncbi:cellulose biosynthesis protein BcsC [uncultured Pseudomonas sp.]|uniref:cellulose biosynthesis protein BcsC n=1 Tax=uncultured Pseudomonas sp. TaxID=114707 RepID=UPI0025EF373A|nr:cellulose biosynthesis protein BcsC [uncultured Pseudomonas sp.]
MTRVPLLATLLTGALTPALALALDEPQALLIEQGHFWQARKNASRAQETWNKLLELDARQPEALYGLGLIEVQAGRLPAAQGYLRRLQAITPLPQQALQLEQDIALASGDNPQRLVDARQFVSEEKPVQALPLYRQLFGGRLPQGDLAKEYYDILAYTPNGWQEAGPGIERLRKLDPDDPALMLIQAKHLARFPASRSQGIQALARLSTRKDIGGEASEYWRQALVWSGPPGPAEAPLFEAYLRQHPDDAELRAQLEKGRALSRSGGLDPQLARGIEALRRGDLGAAESAFQARLKVAPNDPNALGGLGIVRQRQERFGDAQELLTRASRQPGGTRWQAPLAEVRYWALLAQARSAQQANDFSTARERAEQALRLDSKRPEAPLALAGVQAQTGQLAAAEAGYRRVLQQAPRNLEARRGLIDLLADSDRPAEALRLLDGLTPAEQAKLGNLERLQATRALQEAKLAESRGDLAGARRALENARRANPDDVWTLLALARLQQRQGQTLAARQTLDSGLAKNPQRPEALYVQALFALEQNDPAAARDYLRRIPPAQRSAAMNTLAADLDFDAQVSAARDLARRGQQHAARRQLAELEPRAGQRAGALGGLAAAYAEAGDAEHGLRLLRDVLARERTPDPALRLQYGEVLLRSGADDEVNALLHDLQDQRLSAAQRQLYDDLLYRYRVRQADRLRERGDLVTAYDTLAPALAQRPDDALVNTALARLYLANGDAAKALQLYEPLLRRDPANPRLQLGAADAALHAHQTAYAERALGQAVKLAADDVGVLTDAAGLYRALGRDGRATELLRQVVAVQRRDAEIARPLASAPANPFGPRRGSTALANQAIPPTADQLLAAAKAAPAADAAVTTNDSAAERALDDLLQTRSARVTQGLTVRSNDNESGLGKLTDVEAPLEIDFPLGDVRLAVRVTPVSLTAGSVGSAARNRFGGGPAASAAAPSASPGSQSDSGVGLAVAFSDPQRGLKADIGTTPLGFLYSTPVGGVSLERPLTDNTRYTLSASRRAVIDSLTSFAGSEDARTGQQWGGVTANGFRGQLGYDDSQFGAYAYASWYRLLGNQVADNSRTELGTGLYRYLINSADSRLTLGLALTGIAYDNNQAFFTYGHGGYFSPQRFYALGVPLTWSQRTDRWTWQLRGAVGVQRIAQDGADFYPTDARLQAAASQALGAPAVYGGQSKTSLGYSLYGATEYQLGRQLFVGGNLGVDNGRDYQQLNGGVYLRYTLEPQDRSLALPVSPYRSPYDN